MNKRQESRKKTNQKEGDPLSYTEQYIQHGEREQEWHCTRPPGEGSWQGRAAHANDGRVKVEVHEGHHVNIQLPETEWKQGQGLPGKPQSVEHSQPGAAWARCIRLARAQRLHELCSGEQSKLPP